MPTPHNAAKPGDIAKVVLMPAFFILRIVRPPNDGDYEWLRNPIITFSDWLLDKADWKL
jgi:hypothetical protein